MTKHTTAYRSQSISFLLTRTSPCKTPRDVPFQSTQTPFPPSLSPLLSGQENTQALNVGTIVGIVIGVLLVLTLAAALGCFIFLHRYNGIPRFCSCPQGTLVLEEGHSILPFSAWISRTSPLPHGYSLSSVSSSLTRYCPVAASLTPSSFILLFSRKVVSNFFAHHGLHCPWKFPGKNTRVGCHFLLKGLYLTQESNSHLLHWQVDSLPLNHQEVNTIKTPPCPSSLYVGWQVVSTQKKVCLPIYLNPATLMRGCHRARI